MGATALGLFTTISIRKSNLYCLADCGQQHGVSLLKFVLGKRICIVRQTGDNSTGFLYYNLYQEVEPVLSGRLGANSIGVLYYNFY